jgi:transcriptional regulator with XRE-family HTH domain
MDIFEIRLKELRTEKGLTQKDLARILQTTDDSIFSWEKGRSQPSIDTLRKMCIYFDVSADYLLGLEDETGAKIYTQNTYNNYGNHNGDVKF